MAVDEEVEEEREEIDPGEELKRLNRQLARNKWLLVASLSVFTVIICVLGTGLTVMFLRIAELSTPPPEEMTERFAAIEEQLQALSNFRDAELAKIQEYSARVELLRVDCSAATTAPFKDFLAQRETDFQALLKTIMAGTTSLANMTQGARQWVDKHNAALDELVDQSRMRQQELKSVN